MDEITHTILPNGGNWGGTALGAGVGGLIGSWLGNPRSNRPLPPLRADNRRLAFL